MIGYNTQIIVTESDSRESPQSKTLEISNSEKIYLNVKRAEKTSSRPAGNWERLSVVVEQHNSEDFFCKILAKNPARQHGSVGLFGQKTAGKSPIMLQIQNLR